MNDLTLTQLSTVLNSIVHQATGKTNIVATNTADFVAVGQKALKVGYDPLLNSISQVLSKTIFAVRPYQRKFGNIEVSVQKYGNITRKLSISDKVFTDDARIQLVDGSSVDMYKVNKPNILQLNFYGQKTYSKNITIFRDQLDTAFSSPEEFASFLGMVMQNANDLLEMARENLARATVANFITGKIKGDSGSVIHLLTEYNALTGLTLTDETVYQPHNFKSFIQWAYSRMASVSSMMSERSVKYHVNIADKEISRHTPLNRQKAYIYAESKYQIDSMVLANTFNETYLKGIKAETVNFWQSIEDPSQIKNMPVYLLPTGELSDGTEEVTQDKVFAVIFDEDALGYTMVNQWNAPTPFNANGGYSNVFWHETCKYWNDFTENGVVFILD